MPPHDLTLIANPVNSDSAQTSLATTSHSHHRSADLTSDQTPLRILLCSPDKPNEAFASIGFGQFALNKVPPPLALQSPNSLSIPKSFQYKEVLEGLKGVTTKLQALVFAAHTPTQSHLPSPFLTIRTPPHHSLP
ncbi:hypothetical protein JAAARDRAFT_200271 [Jaapia argillacea MUCL 33604]|uniref:Uncharacterized protein n=1 Tax=Jaapia argillacea MUCL 33604 TaxID=933084 RepID=A0A067P5B2_9AGAM|nr:hypothetical protein JAAARDRAFT_200271 [Jaapia argillacea MUCL 33604]